MAVLVLGGAGAGLYFLLAGDGGGADGEVDGQAVQASVSVQTGVCNVQAGTTPVDVSINPPGAATVTLASEDGSFTTTFSEAGGSEPVSPGTYSWTAAPTEGNMLTGETSGTVTASECEELPELGPRELELINLVPANVRDSCQQVAADQSVARAVASLVCESGEATLFYDLFPNTRDMQAYYDSRVREFGVTRGSGFCDSAQEAENSYVRKRGGREVEIGRLVCFRDGGNAVLIWTDNRVNISVEALRRDRNNDELYRQWARVAFGPLS